MKKCELCTSPASMYCESDSASLCWDCDSKVHSANFLVERHPRSLLCHVCQSLTSWTASGMKLARTLSVCEDCVARTAKDERDCYTDEDYESEDDDDDDDEDEEEDDEQVVPWTFPMVAAATSDESSSGKGGFCSKRLRDGDLDLASDDDFGCSSSHQNAISFSARDNGDFACVNSYNRFKRLRTQPGPVCTPEFGPTRIETSSDENAEVVISDQNTLAGGSETADSS